MKCKGIPLSLNLHCKVTNLKLESCLYQKSWWDYLSNGVETDRSQASSELKMLSLWNGNLTSSMNYHVMRATLHILAKLSIPCVRGSFLGLMHVLNSTSSLSPRSNSI